MDKKRYPIDRDYFDTDNFFMQICEKILDLATVNLLFLLTSLPLLTIGIARLSLYIRPLEIKGRRKSNGCLYQGLPRNHGWASNWPVGGHAVCYQYFDLLLIWGQEALPFKSGKLPALLSYLYNSALLCVYPLAGRFEQSS